MRIRCALIPLFVAFASLAFAGTSYAAPVSCPPIFVDSKSFVLSTTPSATCLDYHEEPFDNNINGSNNDGFLDGNAGWVYLDVDNSAAGGLAPGALTIVGNGSATGTYSINAALIPAQYTLLALGLKTGNNAPGPVWAVFQLGGLSGDWEIREYAADGTYKGKELSHANLYGKIGPEVEEQCTNCPSVVPEPASLLLLGSGLLGLGAARRRRKARLS